MPRKFLRNVLPDQDKLNQNAFLRRYAHRFMHPNLWHLNRHSVAGGVAAGAVGGMIPGPLQIITAALLALGFRVNLPVAVFTTFYTNPLTIGPLYWVAVQIGGFVTGRRGTDRMPPMPSWSDHTWFEWGRAMCDWTLSLGVPLLVGLPVLTALLAVGGYLAVKLFWRVHVLWQLRGRSRRRRPVEG
ncbi:hypothetical protein GCM10007860_20320 [Chitiniphilus shinanonensis]|uniref:DUF2062 domain-containing protein n=1 Tax=Chitiniphilus shinanonensis TaxID=553088 RepID=A0ABQ6BYW0_9NEIS|nr:DUF2062 domain-containing protein [Chitiniphilus shinanonensis]GLS04884.1 hypothetical protein GCM10007860_20320 [Chitiniphilus shinanonensis]